MLLSTDCSHFLYFLNLIFKFTCNQQNLNIISKINSKYFTTSSLTNPNFPNLYLLIFTSRYTKFILQYTQCSNPILMGIAITHKCFTIPNIPDFYISIIIRSSDIILIKRLDGIYYWCMTTENLYRFTRIHVP